MKLLIKNVRIVDAFTDKVGSVLIEDDKILKILDDTNDVEADSVIDATNKVVMPGFVDTHAHFRDPGFTYKEDIETGCNAAINGGYTYVNLMANTKPICDNMETWEYVTKRAIDLDICGINQTMALTKGLLGQEIIDIENLPENIKILSDDGKDLLSNHMMYQACILAKKYRKTIMVHAEESEISPYDYRVAEDLVTIRDIYLSGKTGCHIHMSHMSTEDAVEALRFGKSKGYNVTGEVTPHHISLYDMPDRVNPPIRTQKDVEALILAIKDGTIDCIGTDHAPHSMEDKKKGSPGFVGIETAFSVCYTYLVNTGHIDMKALSRLMSYGGCKVLGLEKRGLIQEGYFADLCIVDLNEKTIVNAEKFKSKSKNSPYIGRELVGKVVTTVREGKVTVNDN